MKIVVLGGAGQMSAITVTKELAFARCQRSNCSRCKHFEKARKIAKENGPNAEPFTAMFRITTTCLGGIKGADCNRKD